MWFHPRKARRSFYRVEEIEEGVYEEIEKRIKKFATLNFISKQKNTVLIRSSAVGKNPFGCSFWNQDLFHQRKG